MRLHKGTMKRVGILQREPLYSQIKEIINGRIENKQYKLYKKLPREVELCKEFGVSRPTIRHALAELVEEGYLVRKRKQGTTIVNPHEGLQIDVVCSCPEPQESKLLKGEFPPLLLDRFQGLIEMAVKLKMKSQYLRVSPDTQGMKYLLDRTSTNRRRPIIFLGHQGYEEMISKLHQMSYPYVVTHTYDYNTEFNSIVIDFKYGCKKAIEYLIKLGHKRIGFLYSGSRENPWFIPRFEGYRKALEENRIELKPELVKETNGGLQEIYHVTDELLDLDPPPTAIFAANDQVALYAVEKLKQRKVRIPKDISIVGFDNIREAREAEPALTTVDGKRYESGSEAVKLILQIMNRRVAPPAKVVLRPKLVVRKSCQHVMGR